MWSITCHIHQHSEPIPLFFSPTHIPSKLSFPSVIYIRTFIYSPPLSLYLPTSHHIAPHHTTSHHITPHHTSHHITPHHTTSHHITPHHTGPPVTSGSSSTTGCSTKKKRRLATYAWTPPTNSSSKNYLHCGTTCGSAMMNS